MRSRAHHSIHERVQSLLKDSGLNHVASLQVVICINHLTSYEEVRNAIVHELIHAYDHCRAASLDWTNCDHHACSEVVTCATALFTALQTH